MRIKKQSPEWEAGFNAARILYEGRYNFVANPERQCANAKRLAVQCPTCWAEEFKWCRYVHGKSYGDYTSQLHVTRQGK